MVVNSLYPSTPSHQMVVNSLYPSTPPHQMVVNSLYPSTPSHQMVVNSLYPSTALHPKALACMRTSPLSWAHQLSRLSTSTGGAWARSSSLTERALTVPPGG